MRSSFPANNDTRCRFAFSAPNATPGLKSVPIKLGSGNRVPIARSSLRFRRVLKGSCRSLRNGMRKRRLQVVSAVSRFLNLRRSKNQTRTGRPAVTSRTPASRTRKRSIPPGQLRTPRLRLFHKQPGNLWPPQILGASPTITYRFQGGWSTSTVD